MNFDLPGWSPALAAAFEPLLSEDPTLVPGRVVRQDGRWLRVAVPGGKQSARASGRLEHDATGASELPTIGDWVALRSKLIERVLPRTSLLIRRGSDDGRTAQLIAANADQVLLVVGLDHEPNLRWLERAMTLVWDSGARPLVVMNKVDLTPVPDTVMSELQSALPGVPLIAVSATTGDGISTLVDHLAPGETAVLLGTSGVGKSSLVNRLLGRDAQATRDVRERDRKGRHTTSHRALLQLPHGALLIDGPGMRELGLWAADGGLQHTFHDVQALAQACRFRDCTHDNEPGCAVVGAAERGALTQDRLESFRKLQREQRWLESTATADGRARLKRNERALSKAAWTASRDKRPKK